MPIDPAAPPPVQAALDELLAALKPLVPAAVRAVVLYGGLAKGKAMTGSSDVNVLIVLADGAPETLLKLAAPLARARRSAGVAPLIVNAAELDSAVAAFPLKFHDIVRSHRVLLGDDPLAGRKVAPADLRGDARRTLAGMSLRLKRLAVERGERADLLLEGLIDALPGALAAFAGLLEADGTPVPERREDLLAAAAKRLGFDPAPLLALLAVKKGGERPADLGPLALLGALLAAVERGARP